MRNAGRFLPEMGTPNVSRLSAGFHHPPAANAVIQTNGTVLIPDYIFFKRNAVHSTSREDYMSAV